MRWLPKASPRSSPISAFYRADSRSVSRAPAPAVIYPKAHDLLTRFDETSEHYDATWCRDYGVLGGGTLFFVACSNA